MSLTNEEILEEVVKRVSAYDIRRQGPYPEPTNHIKSSRRAAILLPITVKHGEVFVLLTKRSKDLRSHPSTVSFPGGMRDEIDQTDIDAALREAEEEIGLPPTAVKILGILTLGVTLPTNVVYPVVGIIPENFLPNCNPSEVEYAFYMPLKLFIEEGKVSQADVKVKGKTMSFPIVNYTHDNHTDKVFGFTCNYCIFLAAIVFRSVGKEKERTLADEMQSSLELYFHYVTTSPRPKL